VKAVLHRLNTHVQWGFVAFVAGAAAGGFVGDLIGEATKPRLDTTAMIDLGPGIHVLIAIVIGVVVGMVVVPFAFVAIRTA